MDAEISTTNEPRQTNGHFLPSGIITSIAVVLCLALGVSSSVSAGPREQAKRIYDRLIGTPPSADCLDQLEAEVAANNATGAALDAMTDDRATTNPGDKCIGQDFYRVTLKNFITPWTNEEQTVFAPLNDYTATVIGIIRDEYDFRSILYDNVLYVGSGISPAYATDNNDHYQAMTDQNSDLQAILTRTTQSSSSTLGLPTYATAGVITTRQGAKAYFVDGTNRAMFRFTFINHMCTDLQEIKDTSRTPDRIRRDVSRSPGGDSRIFMNACVGCHSGMDPMAQAFAYYDYEYPLDGNNNPLFDQGHEVYNDVGFVDPDTGTRVQGKYHINDKNFEFGYSTPDDHWDNYWRAGPNSVLGWGWSDNTDVGSGSGAASLGKELADSYAFAHCQVKKVFKAVCLRPPVDVADRTQIDTMVNDFKTATGKNTTGFNLKEVFAESAAYCMGN
jgi:hypothetical protein